MHNQASGTPYINYYGIVWPPDLDLALIALEIVLPTMFGFLCHGFSRSHPFSVDEGTAVSI